MHHHNRHQIKRIAVSGSHICIGHSGLVLDTSRLGVGGTDWDVGHKTGAASRRIATSPSLRRAFAPPDGTRDKHQNRDSGHEHYREGVMVMDERRGAHDKNHSHEQFRVSLTASGPRRDDDRQCLNHLDSRCSKNCKEQNYG